MEEPQPDLNQQERESKGMGGLWLWLLVAVCAYVLSIGPVAGICERTNLKSQKAMRTLAVVYAPVLALYKTPLRSALLWWIELWVGGLNPKVQIAVRQL